MARAPPEPPTMPEPDTITAPHGVPAPLLPVDVLLAEESARALLTLFPLLLLLLLLLLVLLLLLLLLLTFEAAEFNEIPPQLPPTLGDKLVPPLPVPTMALRRPIGALNTADDGGTGAGTSG